MKEKDFLKNNRLFSDYYLKELLPKEPIWDIDVSETFSKIKEIYERKKDIVAELNERSLEDQFIRPILKILSHKWEVEPSLKNYKKPDYSFYETEEEKVKAELSKDYFGNAIAVGEIKRWERPLDKKLKDESDPFEVYSPSLQMERYLWFTEVKWGILTNGRLWRIYERGTSNKLDIYYEVDLINILENYDLEAFKYFHLFFRKEAFPDFLDKVYEESIDYAKAVGEDLKSNVYKAIRILANGFLETPGNNLSIDNLQEIHDNSLIFLYRLLFILYAESRGLLPLQKSIYRESYSIYSIKKVIAKKKDRNESIPILQKSYWGKIKVLFELINSGSESYDISKDEFFVPPYNGGLFNPDKNTFLEKNEISDYFTANVIDLLSRSTIKNEVGKAFVDYSSLDIRHLGSIYEGLLENKLKVAQEDMSTIKSGRKEIWIKSKELGNRKAIDNVLKGKLYPVTDKGERKATGSYYTPDYIVKYIVENTIGPLIEEKRSKLEREEDLIDEILSLKILDPAMGSGHFLVEATDFIARSLVEAIGASPKEIEEEDIRWARREVVEKCIYGVDLNPLAVELAKLSLWLSTVSKDKPLSFLDHHLKCGNSLIGVRIEDLAELPDIKSKKMKKMIGQISTYEILFNKKIEVLLNNRKLIEELPSEKVEQIREKEKYEEEFRKKIERFKQIADLWTSIYFGNEISWQNYITVQDKLESSGQEWQEILDEEWFEIGLNIYKEKKFFHWELEFPEIFYEGDRKKENPGFDVVMGNPPYVRQELIKEQKLLFKELYPEVYTGTADLCVYFVKRSLDLTKSGCYHSFIITNKWVRANYGENLRKYLTENVEIDEIVDFTGIKVFEGSTIDVLVYTFKNKEQKDNKLRYCDYKNSTRHNIKEYVEKNSFDIEQETLKQGWILYPKEVLEIKKKIEKVGESLKEWDVKIYRGIVTGFNKAFIITQEKRNELIKKDKRYEELIKPVLEGKNITKWNLKWENNYIILSYEKTINNIENYHELKNHFLKYIDKLKNMSHVKKGRDWWTLQSPKEYSLFKVQKIVYPDISKEVAFTYDNSGFIGTNTTYNISSNNIDLKLLCLLLNSNLIGFYFKLISNTLGSVAYRFFTQYVEQLPIKILQNQTPFICLCDYMLILNESKERRESEKQLIEFFDIQIIDSLAYELYFADELKTNLIDFVSPYLVDISNLDSDSEKMDVIKEVYFNLIKDKEIINLIEKIKSHKWVKIVENYQQS